MKASFMMSDGQPVYSERSAVKRACARLVRSRPGAGTKDTKDTEDTEDTEETRVNIGPILDPPGRKSGSTSEPSFHRTFRTPYHHTLRPSAPHAVARTCWSHGPPLAVLTAPSPATRRPPC